MKSIILYDLALLINDKEARITDIVTIKDKLIMSVVSSSDKKLTELIKSISESGIYSVKTKEIILDDDNKTKVYQSDIEVGVK